MQRQRSNIARKYAEAIVEHERLQRESLAARRRFARAQEDERRQFALELHDGAGQQLTALSLGLQALSDLAPPGSELGRRATELRMLVNTTGRELHALAVRLRPQALDEFGLAAAVEAYARGWSRRTGITLDLHISIGAARLSCEVETVVYRIVQEALTNVAKHSGAAGASVLLDRRHGTLCVVIADDGCGFDTTALRRPKESPDRGLPGIHERAALLGGSIEVESVPGAGSTLSIRIPLDIMSPDSEPCVRGNGGCD